MNMDCMSVERAVYYRLFLVQGLTERFDRELDERLERENPLSDLTLALSTCGGKREQQIHILNEYILNTAPEQIDKDAVFSFVADELRERFKENPDTDPKAFAMLMRDIAWDSDWWGAFEPWATMYEMPDFYDAAYKEHTISKACFRSIFRRLLYDKTGTDMVRFVIRRKIAFPEMLLPQRIYINGTRAGELLDGGRIETLVPRAKAYYLETDSGSAILHQNGQGFYELTCKMQGGWIAPSEMRFYQKTAGGEDLLPQFPEGRLVTAIFEEKLDTLSHPEQTLALCREFWNDIVEDMDEILYSPYIHEMAEALHEVGATEYEAFLRGMIAQFADVPLPLNDEQIETMRKRINEFNRAETRISKTAMPELRETMALYLVEHLAELENQDKT
jgi:hypothetical protein